ncbi:DMT family transporter [Wenzhouxiangella marina]|uniref:Putative permease, DMT superfamily n=1 Tax=Wenzhouxiangella marina TaxID=1579979 RepID=A0A0K0XYJ9_9GAMM|nr:EamA family transporter [Wenzhouxiangella marina]AKS42696.1 Putative permease, DMT superfamily [Wenzhouxiangella marina]MBB6088615.1 drug/metabolite transporter (DMT)-like permease [Wenzhouxiangella marina]
MSCPSTLLLLLAALFWGLSGGLGGVLIDRGWDPLVISFYRGAVGLLAVLCWVAVHPKRSGLGRAPLWFWSVLAGLGVTGNFALYFVSVEHGSLAVGATLMYCAPVFVYLVSFSFGLEPPTAGKWVAMALVLVGILLLVEVHRLDAAAITPVALAAGLLSGACYALFIFGFKYASAHGNAAAILSIAFLVLVSVLAWPSDHLQLRSAWTSPDWPLFLAIGVLGAGLSFVLYVIGLRHTPPPVASVVAMIEPVTASLFAFAVLGERLTVVQWSGVALILSTVTVLSMISRDHRRPRRLRLRRHRTDRQQ